MKITLALFLMIPFIASALEVDEKLTVRVMKTSESRKTIMVNRGTEDGLVEGDHARFIVTAGVVARGVCSKVSPTRSVWSVYRLVNADLIVTDAVMTLKITPPVKLTQDETQSIVAEDTPTRVANDPAALGIPLAEGAEDTTGPDNATNMDAADLAALEETTIAQKNVELVGVVSLSGLTAKSVGSSDVGTYSGSQTFYHIGLGGEIYPRKEKQWFSRFSLLANLNLMRENAQSYEGSSVTNDVTEVQFGTNWHWGKMPSLTANWIPFLHLSFGIGQVKSSYKAGANNIGFSDNANGSTTSLSVGFGYKYYTRSGFGFRAMVDYYQRGEKFKEDTQVHTFSRTVNGPRVMMGMSYRF